MQEYFEVGVITTTHGLKGEVKVFVTSDDPFRFDSLEEVFYLEKGERKTLEIQSVRYFKNLAIVKFRGLDRIEDVEKLRGIPLNIDREAAEPLEEGEYYVGDLYGCKVLLEDGTEFGTVSEVIRTGANDVLVVKRLMEKDALLPVIRDCVTDMDLEKGIITVHIMKGLLD